MEQAYAALVVASLLTGGVMWLATLHSRIILARRDAGETTRKLRAHEDLCSERYASIERQHDESRQWMARLESKLDRLIERQ